MVKEEILEGLKVALSKGESLQKAMMSFFNAGYSKEEVEEAASLLQAPSLHSNQFLQQGYYSPGQPQIMQFGQSSQTIQRVSGYGEPTRKKRTIMTMLLIPLLILLVGSLAVAFLFKDELANFFNKLLGA